MARIWDLSWWVADRVQLVKPGVVGVVHVIIALVTGGEAPAAVPVAIRLLPVAVANLAALHRASNQLARYFTRQRARKLDF